MKSHPDYGSGQRPTLLTLNLPRFMTVEVGERFARDHYRVVIAGADPQHLSDAITEIERRVPGASILAGLVKPDDERAVRHLLSSVGPEVSALHLHVDESCCHGPGLARVGALAPACALVVTAIETAAALMTARAYGRILVTVRRDPLHVADDGEHGLSPAAQLERFIAARRTEFVRRDTHIRFLQIEGDVLGPGCAETIHALLNVGCAH